MHRTDRAFRTGFTLLELMIVIAIIGILMAMLGAAAYSARQRAYATTATAEVQQIVTAFKSYYLVHHEWPGDWAGGKGGEAGEPLTKSALAPLIDGDEGAYLDISDFRFEDDQFLDPWGNPYRVSTDRVDTPSVSDVFEGAVSFPNHMRHYYEEGVYSSLSGAWNWGGGDAEYTD